jgi:hypothetical protein
MIEFAALIWLRVKQPAMARPFRIPCGTAGVVAMCVPPLALCLLSIMLSNDATKYASVGGIVTGLLVYWWQAKAIPLTDVKTTPAA